MINFLFFIFLLFPLLTGITSQASGIPEYPPETPQPKEIWKDPLSGLEFLWLAGDCFQLGTSDTSISHFLHEKPRHKVCLDGFWIGRHEVTNSQYRQYKADHNSGQLKSESLDGDDQPVVYVSWYEAKAYAAWLTEQSNGKYSFRLPTEAEWEFGCRAGTDTIRFWGQKRDDACQYANVADLFYQVKRINYHNCIDGFIVSAPVGKFPANDAGLHDMLGNVWEWCEDHYGKDAYIKHKEKNPLYQEIENGMNYRVIRGGSWLSEPDSIRCAKRSPAQPESKFNVLGFRLVLEVRRTSM